MALTIEWRRRIDNWRRELPRHFYHELATVDLEGYTTRDQLTASEALRGDFDPAPPGWAWGAKWEYGWFRGQVTLPDEARDQRIVLKVNVGAESAVLINGHLAGAIDAEHHEILLSHCGVPGTEYSILVEGYAGHGPRVEYAGPTPPGRETVPEPGPTQAVIGRSTVGIWQEDVYQLHMDVETLTQLRDVLDPNSLRVVEIDEGLRDFTLTVDFEAPPERVLSSCRACRKRLAPLLTCVNGSTTPTLFAFGHSHIDVAWLWPLAETERKAGRTLATQLALMQEYPEYRFIFSQPHLYRMIQRRYPDLYERIKAAVQAGQIMPEGGMWVEADTNISSGESLIRQFIHGKRFFRDEFGIESRLLWLPDVFGYSGALPQIMRGCSIEYFATAKIFWAYNGGDPFPYNTFTWEGIDGSHVLVHLCNDYNSHTHPTATADRWNGRVQKDGISTRLYPFGFGDGGGGPTRDHLEYLRREGDLEGLPRVKIASPIDYFEDQVQRGVPNTRYVGELYFQAHRGTYTSQAKTKRGNRKSELTLREAEMWSAAAAVLADYAIPHETMDELWKVVLLNQFHDIIPGSSIHRVYEEAEAAYNHVLTTADRILENATTTLVKPGNAWVIFNSLSWPRTALAALPAAVTGARLPHGASLPVQEIAGRTYVEVTIPACGWATFEPGSGTDVANTLRVSEMSVENEHLRIEFNDFGEIVSLYDKDAGRELATGTCNRLRMYKDVPTGWDAWDIDSMYALTPVELAEPADIEILAEGPLVAGLRVTRRLNQSVLTQEITLRRGQRRVDFHTVIDWQESHKLLKVDFEVDIHAHEALHEIQFGHIARPNHLSRPFDADRFEVSNHKWTALVEANRGAAVLNDCKYGINVLGQRISLTLLKSPLAPDMTADRGRQEFTYAFYTWNGCFAESDVIREAYDLNCPVTVAPGVAGERSLFAIDAPNIIVDTVKTAEDGRGDVIIRLYECKRAATRCTLECGLPIQAVMQTNMLEEGDLALNMTDGRIELEFRPFEVKTLRLSRI
ncbi:MAG: alpha-mannosidase [Chloroflexi bacterium]|nr:alpha-mannosidase [Chloroflexota bacterium]